MGTGEIFNSRTKQDDQWISVSDLMTGLMIIFLFISISYMRDVIIDRDRIQEIAITWQKTQDLVYEALKKEFEEDLKKWKGKLVRENLTITFPEAVGFKKGSDKVTSNFQSILSKFFPRYLSVLENYKDKIVEIRIEGHTSSEWRKDTSEIDAYINNMELSQNRTRSVLDYTFYKSGLYKRHNWAKKMITANGLSSSKLIRYKKDSTFLEDRKRSRRVEFKVVTISKELIQQIIRRNINYEK